MSNPPKIFHYRSAFPLESGGSLPGIDIAYHTYGTLNEEQNNVVWICHALTANSDPPEWWPGLVGRGKLYDPEKHFVVCANTLSSCYGSTGPLSVNPETGQPWYRSFPLLTIRDLVTSLDILRRHLGIRRIKVVTGGSMGGHQAMEWAISRPELFDHLVLLATNAVMSPWGIAFNQSQRLAIEADGSFFDDRPDGGLAGMKAARSVALLSYRNRTAYNLTQSEESAEKTADFRASSYQVYQGDKLVKRFNAYAYHSLSRTMDTHNVGRGRGSAAKALEAIRARTLAISVSSDILFPPEELKYIHQLVNGSRYVEIDSPFGHDGFLVESGKIANIVHECCM
ncbi:MAG: homoserine O-acetyltransferase [Bacteroidales bacterium]